MFPNNNNNNYNYYNYETQKNPSDNFNLSLNISSPFYNNVQNNVSSNSSSSSSYSLPLTHQTSSSSSSSSSKREEKEEQEEQEEEKDSQIFTPPDSPRTFPSDTNFDQHNSYIHAAISSMTNLNLTGANQQVPPEEFPQADLLKKLTKSISISVWSLQQQQQQRLVYCNRNFYNAFEIPLDQLSDQLLTDQAFRPRLVAGYFLSHYSVHRLESSRVFFSNISNLLRKFPIICNGPISNMTSSGKIRHRLGVIKGLYSNGQLDSFISFQLSLPGYCKIQFDTLKKDQKTICFCNSRHAIYEHFGMTKQQLVDFCLSHLDHLTRNSLPNDFLAKFDDHPPAYLVLPGKCCMFLDDIPEYEDEEITNVSLSLSGRSLTFPFDISCANVEQSWSTLYHISNPVLMGSSQALAQMDTFERFLFDNEMISNNADPNLNLNVNQNQTNEAAPIHITSSCPSIQDQLRSTFQEVTFPLNQHQYQRHILHDRSAQFLTASLQNMHTTAESNAIRAPLAAGIIQLSPDGASCYMSCPSGLNDGSSSSDVSPDDEESTWNYLPNLMPRSSSISLPRNSLSRSRKHLKGSGANSLKSRSKNRLHLSLDTSKMKRSNIQIKSELVLPSYCPDMDVTLSSSSTCIGVSSGKISPVQMNETDRKCAASFTYRIEPPSDISQSKKEAEVYIDNTNTDDAMLTKIIPKHEHQEITMRRHKMLTPREYSQLYKRMPKKSKFEICLQTPQDFEAQQVNKDEFQIEFYEGPYAPKRRKNSHII